MKKVFSNHSEVAHVWAQRTQNEGRVNNMFFEDGVIYSYGKHFELAKFIEHAGKTYLFVNTASYSNSTSKHQNHVRKAINSSLVDKVFYFDFKNVSSYWYSSYTFHLDKNNLLDVIKNAHELAKQYFEKQLRARSETFHYRTGISNFALIQELITEFKDILDLNGVSQSQSFLESLEPLRAEALQKYNHLEETRAQRLELKRIKEEEQREKQAQKEREKIGSWLKGEISGTFYNLPIYLRLVGEEIETSHGARVPLSRALEVLESIEKRDYIIGQRLGHYTINEITSDFIKIGCHTIYFNNVRTFLDGLKTNV